MALRVSWLGSHTPTSHGSTRDWSHLYTPTSHGSMRDLIRLAHTHHAWLHAWPDQTRTHPPRMASRVTWLDLHTPTTHGSLRDLIRLANTHLTWLYAWPDHTCTHPLSVTPHMQHCSTLWVPLSKQAIILLDFVLSLNTSNFSDIFDNLAIISPVEVSYKDYSQLNNSNIPL